MTNDELIAVLGDNTEAVTALNGIITGNVSAVESAQLEATRFKTELEALQATTANNQGNVDATQSALEARIAEMETQNQAQADKAQKAQDKLVRAELKAKLGDDFVGVDSLVNELVSSGRVEVSDDNAVSLKVDGNVVGWSDGIKSLQAEKADMVKVKQVGGLGTGGGKSNDPTPVKLDGSRLMALSAY